MKIRSVRYLTFEGFKNVWVNRLMSLASIGVLIATMLLIGVAIALSLNVNAAMGDLEKQNVVMVYFPDGTPYEENQRTIAKIKDIDNIDKVIYVPKEEGLQSILDQMGQAYVEFYEGEENPLPDGAQITFKEIKYYNDTYGKLTQMPGVMRVNGSKRLADTITSIGNAIPSAGFIIILFLMIIALLIISNTIRITMHNRRLEISIMKAVGATNGFIRFPFVVEGMILGVVSGVITMGFLYVIYRLAIINITQAYAFEPIMFRSFAFWMCGLFVGIGLAAGILGSLFTLGKYLKKEGSAFGAIH